MMNVHNTHYSCRLCSSSDMTEILNLGAQPPANSLSVLGAQGVAEVPLVLMFCNACQSLQLRDIVDPNELFQDYVWVTGTSAVANEYKNVFAKNIIEKAALDTPYIIEIASNDGTFLSVFKNAGFDVLGVDPARNIAELANENGIPTEIDFFSETLAKGLHEKLPPQPKIVIARNVIPHVPNIDSVINGIQTLIGQDGIGAIEFHNSALLSQELQYDYIYHEHVFYFTLTSMKTLLARYDMEIFDLFMGPISGGSYCVLFKHKDMNSKQSQAVRDAEAFEAELGLAQQEVWQNFARQCEAHKHKAYKLIKSLCGKVVGYGASARSSTFLNYCALNHNDIRFIIDKNPLKHHKKTAGSEIDITSFDDGIATINPDDTILLLAWNFKDEIVSELRANGINNKIITPFPDDINYYED